MGAVGDAFLGHDGPVLCVAWSGDGGRVASGAEDKTVRVWDVEKGEVFGEAFLGHDGCASCVALYGDGRRVAFGAADKTVRVWDVEKGEAVGESFLGHNGPVWCVALSGDGRRVASGADDKTVRVWDVESGECIFTEYCSVGDRTRLEVVLKRGDAVAEEHLEESIVKFEGTSVVYCSGCEETVLATLESIASWDYAPSTRSIAAGRPSGAVDFFTLVE